MGIKKRSYSKWFLVASGLISVWISMTMKSTEDQVALLSVGIALIVLPYINQKLLHPNSLFNRIVRISDIVEYK